MPIDLALNKSTKKPAQIEPAILSKHSVILAQSGAGKSFMLGRLIEELALKTKARIIVFDPNSDFIRLNQLDNSIWSDSRFKPWFFRGESSKRFAAPWQSVSMTVASNRNLPSARKLVLDWGSLSHYEMASVMNIDPRADSDLYWCLFLTWEIASETWQTIDEPFYDFDHFRDQSEKVVEYLLGGSATQPLKGNPLANHLRSSLGRQVAFRFKSLVDSIEEYQIWRSKGDGEIDIRKSIPGSDEAPRILVVDLQSLSRDEERYSLVNNVLAALWARGRQEQWEAIRDIESPDPRVPTFIVVDEAHNLIPDQKLSTAVQQLSAMFVRTAAEGRKYGLHLIVVTQRPRKIDVNILTECDNLFLMKMTNDNDLRFASDMLGFLSMPTARRSKTLSVGDLILAGALGKGSTILHVSPRRTMQGGRDIPKNWTSP